MSPSAETSPIGWMNAYRLRWKRRRLLWRSFRSRHQLTPIAIRADRFPDGTILCFSTVRNEITRLPFYLEHYRRIGVSHFLMVDNGSNDGTAEYLRNQHDVSLWHTNASYREARFGVDWLTWLQMRYGKGNWCLTADADEILTFPYADRKSLQDLTQWLGRRGVQSFGALMLDMYPKGRIGSHRYKAGDNPFETLNWFDAEGYTWTYLERYRQISIRGGPRKRFFFKESQGHEPHLHKIPLVRWSRRYAYVSSTHTILPRRLNSVFDARLNLPSGVLLHSKFLDEAIHKSAEEKQRKQHFAHTQRYDSYYDQIVADPDLSYARSVRFEGWRQLEKLGLMTRGDWR